ncbi:DUF6074 family protein [Aliihoeflea aestuarii]|jgi:hypothetical protein|uniref:DUF6074 family protein n=1 Tax=Aliihoeflea aestuarii TaxID=453840 RepID=UPI0035582B85
MQRDDTPLLSWQLPFAVIPFPALKRSGHARKIAQQLSKARTNREADWILHRALSSAHDQMVKAGILSSDADDELGDFRFLIHSHCIRINARWVPALEDDRTSGGVA